MKTEIFTVTSQGQGMNEALAVTERMGMEAGLERKQILRLRLLSEELFGLLRGIAGEVEADYWLERTDRQFALHLKSEVTLTRDMHEQLVAVSTSGENAAAKGFMGKIREMIAVSLLPKDSGTSILSGLSLGLMSMAAPSANTYRWSMKKYKEAVESERKGNMEAEEAWDELERSIVASIADEVSVCVTGSCAEITIFKAFD